MKLNSNGLTLIELLISIILTSVVLAFLFALLSDIRAETRNHDYALANQTTKIEIIKAVQKDLRTNHLTGIENTTNTDLTLTFHFLEGDATLTIESKGDEDYVRYTNVLEEKASWLIKEGTIDPCASFIFKKDSTNSYYFKLNFLVYSKPYHEKNNQNINNALDDMEIFFYTADNNLIENDLYLTNQDNVNTDICQST